MDIASFAIDSALTSILYYYYKKKTRTLEHVQNAVELNPTKNDKPPDEIPYGMVVGQVTPESHCLTSNYNKEYRGVVRICEVKEHKTRINKDIKSDHERSLSYDIDFEPFKLTKRHMVVKIAEAETADYLTDNLTNTYKHFEANKDSFAAKLATALLVKEHIKGYETSESMLLNGTEVTCFGKLTKIPEPVVSIKAPSWLPGQVAHNFYLSAPDAKDKTFIITTMSRKGLIEHLKGTTTVLKICFILFGAIGVGIGIYIGYSRIKPYIETKQREWRLEQMRKQRIEERRARARLAERRANLPAPDAQGQVDQQQAAGSNEETSNCVVCLTNPREIVLLDCGHVCLCMECMEMLPNKACPICRENYRSFAPCYIP